MLSAHVLEDGRLRPLPAGADLTQAVWIDVVEPGADDIAALSRLGIRIPTLADMEEIEVSNRLFHEGEAEYMTAALPGLRHDRTDPRATGAEDRPGDMSRMMPVTFILSAQHLVTIRHHQPHAFASFLLRSAGKVADAGGPAGLFLHLVEEITGNLADLLEHDSHAIDANLALILDTHNAQPDDQLRGALRNTAARSQALADIRLALLGIGRMLTYFSSSLSTCPAGLGHRPDAGSLQPLTAEIMGDLQALEVHADFLENRASLTMDAAIGMITMRQNDTVKALSVVAAVFLPPMLIASIYGMNFAGMNELQSRWGYPAALGGMALSAILTWLVLKWRRWM